MVDYMWPVWSFPCHWRAIEEVSGSLHWWRRRALSRLLRNKTWNVYCFPTDSRPYFIIVSKNIHKENHTLLHRFSVYDFVMFLCGSPKLNSQLRYINFCWTIASPQHGLWLLVSGVKLFFNSVWPKHRLSLLVQWKTRTSYPCALNAVIHWINVN